MKMAKASERDIDAAGELLNLLNEIDTKFNGPWPTDGPDSLHEAIGNGEFDADNHKHLQALYNNLAALLRRAPNFHGRVIGGMCYVILYDKNEIVDPDADTIELHPKLQAGLQDTERLDWIEQQGNAFTWGIREHTEPVGSYVVSLGDKFSVDGPTFRAAIDQAIAAAPAQDGGN